MDQKELFSKCVNGADIHTVSKDCGSFTSFGYCYYGRLQDRVHLFFIGTIITNIRAGVRWKVDYDMSSGKNTISRTNIDVRIDDADSVIIRDDFIVIISDDMAYLFTYDANSFVQMGTYQGPELTGWRRLHKSTGDLIMAYSSTTVHIFDIYFHIVGKYDADKYIYIGAGWIDGQLVTVDFSRTVTIYSTSGYKKESVALKQSGTIYKIIIDELIYVQAEHEIYVYSV